ncbi:MAG: hypothetical protein ACRD2D_07295, partial [Terriglobales bacterium]
MQVFVADGAHAGLEGGGFLRVRDEAGGKEPVDFVLLKRTGEPAEEQKRGAGDGNSRERNAERKFEGRKRGRRRGAKEGALNLAAVRGNLLRENE